MNTIRIFLVDDNENYLKAHKTILGNNLKKHFPNKEFKFYTANDGMEGVQLAKIVPADIIVTDILMPCKSGIQMVQDILNTYEFEVIPPEIILCHNGEKRHIRIFENIEIKKGNSKLLIMSVVNAIEKHQKALAGERIVTALEQKDALTRMGTKRFFANVA